jgi:hypothetical protein
MNDIASKFCPDCGKSHPAFDPVPLLQDKRPNGTLVAAEWTVGRAANFVVPIGTKHKGRKIACVAAVDPGWLAWAVDCNVPSVKKAASVYLDFLNSAATASSDR